ncbi:hypothetical protein [Dyadobacter bucti]|uniref:hypothetical protein n=1 Tax=Dyadobacter bucti TaxID=2572203 RepID=UPI003F729514
MRKIYLSLLAVCLLNVIFNLASAQSIPPTNGAGLLCANCVPTGWTQEDGWPAQSSHLHFGPSNDWVPAVPFPPSGKGVGGSIFMGLQTRLENHDAKVSTSITGLVPGKGYKFTYYVISAKTNDSEYGEDIRVILEQDAGPQTYISQLTEFSAASNNLDKWIKGNLSL